MLDVNICGGRGQGEVVKKCVEINDKAFSDVEILNKVMDLDNRYGSRNVFDTIEKSSILVTKIGPGSRLNWTVMCLADSFENNEFGGAGIGMRSLLGKGVPSWIERAHLLQKLHMHLRGPWLSGIPIDPSVIGLL